MITRIHGFDWEIYTGRVMPDFAQWLINGDERKIYQLYKETRCAREERFTPIAIYASRTWPRAQTFVKQLPQGSYTRREYQLLCDAKLFTGVSDTYVHRHPPRLYQDSDALRVLWGAIVEEYCQSWFTLPRDNQEPATEPLSFPSDEQDTSRGEIVSLLHSAGLSELAREISEQATTTLDVEEKIQEDGDDGQNTLTTHGIVLGHHPTTLHLRGWLATISLRAMALFELLACGRRCMPFGYRAGEPYEDYIGYLTPDEVSQLALCLHDANAPTPIAAEQDYARFRLAQSVHEFRMIDEVLPTHAETFLKVVCMAAQYKLGLLCSMG